MVTINTHPQPFFFLRTGGKFVRLAFADIIYVEACKNYCKINTVKKNYLVLITMKQLAEVLGEPLFCRVHRSYIISYNFITAFDETSVFIDDKEFPLTISSREMLEKKFRILINNAKEKDKEKGEDAALKDKELNFYDIENN